MLKKMATNSVLLRFMISSATLRMQFWREVSVGLLLFLLFSADDEEMLGAKAGAWWELNPQRGRANNSVVVMRHRIDEPTFKRLMEKSVEESRSGEPGFYFSNDKDWGCNPCCEIGLRPFQFCNLVEINVSDVNTQDELKCSFSRCKSFIGTLQASYTDFHYLRPIWQRTTERDALIGVSMTGIASGGVLNLNMTEASLEVSKVKPSNIADAKSVSSRQHARHV